MRRPVPIISCLLVLVACWRPTSVCAEPIPIRVVSGYIELFPASSVEGGIHLAGTRSFRFDAGFESGSSMALCQPCVPGERVSFSSEFSPPFWGTLSFRGRPYNFDFPSNNGGSVSTSAPAFELPVPPGSSLTFRTGFTMAGFLAVSQPGSESLHFDMTGRGQVTGNFEVYPLGDELGTMRYDLRSLRYDFDPAPVPEPATMALVATGLAGLAFRRRKRIAAQRRQVLASPWRAGSTHPAARQTR